MGVSTYDPNTGEWDNGINDDGGFNDRARYEQPDRYDIARTPELQIVPVSQETPQQSDKGWKPWYNIPS